MTTIERMQSTRTIAAPADQIFVVLSDPDRHQDTEPGDWVRSAVDTAPLTAVGQVFATNMYLEAIGGHYVMQNTVSEFDQDRLIAWEPGSTQRTGDLEKAGWWWRYDLAPADGGTAVTLTYDWSATPTATREEIGGLPPFGPEFLDESLATLDRTVTGAA